MKGLKNPVPAAQIRAAGTGFFVGKNLEELLDLSVELGYNYT
jgi:hypothetical protein